MELNSVQNYSSTVPQNRTEQNNIGSFSVCDWIWFVKYFNGSFKSSYVWTGWTLFLNFNLFCGAFWMLAFLQSVLSVCVDKIHWLCVECWQRFIRFIYTAFLRRIFIGANSPRGGTERTICQKSKREQNQNNGLSVVNIVHLEMIL